MFVVVVEWVYLLTIPIIVNSVGRYAIVEQYTPFLLLQVLLEIIFQQNSKSRVRLWCIWVENYVEVYMSEEKKKAEKTFTHASRVSKFCKSNCIDIRLHE